MGHSSCPQELSDVRSWLLKWVQCCASHHAAACWVLAGCAPVLALPSRKCRYAAAPFACRVLPDAPPSREEVKAMSVGQLKAFLQLRGVSTTGMFEKGEMIDKALSLLS